jgi:hypothetical protein
MIGGVVVFLFGGVTAILSLRMPLGTLRMAGTGLFPLCLGILLMILAALYLAKLIFTGDADREEGDASGRCATDTRQMLMFLGAAFLCLLLIPYLGYPLVSFLLMLFLLRTLGMKRWNTLLALSLSTAFVSYFLFVRWLKIPLPKGWIGL